MDNRLQYILLIVRNLSFIFALLFSTLSSPVFAQNKVRGEIIDFGVNIGMIAIEDFPTSEALGANLTFRATEDFFLQLNVMQASSVELSSFEKQPGQGKLFDDRNFLHYDVLIGYNIFQGEFFTGEKTANLSALYAVAGVGETEFGQESRIATTIGLGYQVAFNRRYILRLDFRDYISRRNINQGDDDALTHNFHFSAGFSYLF